MVYVIHYLDTIKDQCLRAKDDLKELSENLTNLVDLIEENIKIVESIIDTKSSSSMSVYKRYYLSQAHIIELLRRALVDGTTMKGSISSMNCYCRSVGNLLKELKEGGEPCDN